MIAKEDGRRGRGDARKLQLIEGALAVLARDGFAGLTHRSVAQEAGVPLASASYHFDGIDDLALSALLHANQQLVEALETIDDDRSIEALATLLADDLEGRAGLYFAYYELYLLAARKPELRDQATAWLDMLTQRYAPNVHGARLDGLQATIEGLCLHAVVRDQAPSAAQLAEALHASWPEVTRAPAAPD